MFYSRMRSEGFPFIMWGSGGWTLVRRQLVVATFFTPFFASFFASLIPCLWGKLQNLVRFGAHTSPCLWGKLQNLVLASPCLWGKLQNLVLERVCASFVVHSSTGTCLCKLCSIQ